MSNQDFYAYLFASGGRINNDASGAITSSRNARRYEYVEESDAHRREDREITEEPEQYDYLLDSPCIGLKFSDGAKTNNSVVIGWGSNCDIVLSKKRGISRYHAALTFNKNNCLVVRDLGSRCGTRVTYDGEKAEPGFSMDWVVGGVDFVKDKTPVLEISQNVKFKLVVPHHDIKSQQHIDNVAKFRQGTEDIVDLAQLIEVRSYPATELLTALGTSPPSTRPSNPAHCTKVLGEGAFGIMTHMFMVQTGEEYAVKEPKNKSKNGYRLEDWKKEADILSDIQHDNIVALLDAKFDPWPQLFFEYANGGSLSYHPVISDLEEIRYMRQLLSAMAAMHKRCPPIVHRDIKPDNILCFFSPDGTMSVKFADFGLGKNSEQLETYSVDVWSLAVVFAERQNGFPEHPNSYDLNPTAWSTAVWKHCRDKSQGGSEIMSFIMDNMLHINPNSRKTASYCDEKAVQLLNKLSRNPKLDWSKTAPSERTDSFRSLIAELGYRGSSKIDSIVNPSDSDGDDNEDS
ncbi:hypothetical protein TrVGV298_006250 [Trichoderma virens]|nr:hypothetical protein TrVGV298_006250 [Trichoderma virens]